ncbi:MAG: GNAT family N-acetyltransferase [Bacteroidota bacterium]
MEPIQAPIPVVELEKEMTSDLFVKYTNYGNNEIYIFNHLTAPLLMREVGRLRELTFRASGGGTGYALDIDEFDTMDGAFDQLIVWNPRDKDIIGGYRFIHGSKIRKNEHGHWHTPTAELFQFSDNFVKDYLHKTIELGRSWVQPAYQASTDTRKGLFALDNIWDGLGAVITLNPDVKYFFGKITMYLSFDPYARDLILHFLKRFFPDNEGLISPFSPLPLTHDALQLDLVFNGSNYQENYKILSHEVRAHGENIPPLVNTYMNISPTMRTFGTALNPGFGEVEETGIMITIDDIYDTKKERHLMDHKSPPRA